MDFVDVHVDADVPVFIEPTALRIQTGNWHDECIALLQSFFAEVLDAVSTGDTNRIVRLLERLSEPNETHLGLSRGQSRGRGLGGAGAEKIATALARSQAAKSGLLHDLEDTTLFIEGIGRDIVSDITTNVLRGALIGYTQRCAEYYEIPMEEQYSGPIWNPDALNWQEGQVALPRANDDKLLLVPKSIVRTDSIFGTTGYYRGYLRPKLLQREIESGSLLVEVLKTGQRKVSIREIEKKYPKNKLALIKYSEDFPDALPQFRKSVNKITAPPLDHGELAARTSSPPPDFQGLIEQVAAIAPGQAGATLYHRSVEALISAVFYPYLVNPKMENPIHEGRKRIDITYDNEASGGFFYWLSLHYRTSTIPIECKNYAGDPGNPELDQLAGRFSPQRGRVGILCCRSFEGKELFVKRCTDTAKDDRGYIIPLDDDDLRSLIQSTMVDQAEDRMNRGAFTLLRERFDRLVK
ncbi:hypothetical protein [Fodinicola feengrottensis]|uniref:hypothetical protein n=1 Tax=Fodinicola feengrottensis TaxID=435914 RepID=UPI0031E13E9C